MSQDTKKTTLLQALDSLPDLQLCVCVLMDLALAYSVILEVMR